MSTCTETTRMTLSPFEKPPRPDVQCTRDVDEQGRHIGDHQGVTHYPGRGADPTAAFRSARQAIPAFDSLVTWSASGASSCRYAPDEPNRNCRCWRMAEQGDERGLQRVGHRPEDHRWGNCADCGVIFDTTGAARCHDCGYWAYRIEHFTDIGPRGERFVRPHPDGSMQTDWLYAWSPGHGGAFGGRKFRVRFDDGTEVGPADFLWSNGQIPWWLVDRFPANAHVLATSEYELRQGWLDPFGKPLPYTAHPEVRS